MITDDMKSTAYNTTLAKIVGSGEYNYLSGVDDGRDIAQAVVNAAWNRFDHTDVSTHPKSRYAPSGSLWLVIVSTSRISHHKSLTFYRAFDWQCHTVYAYADPADLMIHWQTPYPKGKNDE